MKVTKFGGSSLASAPQLKKVLNIIKDDPERRFVVVSAPGKRLQPQLAAVFGSRHFSIGADSDHFLLYTEVYGVRTDRRRCKGLKKGKR